MKNQKGITLIALIITIIVMLILVGVSVSTALNTGLFKTAQGTAKNTEAAKLKETNLSSGKVTILKEDETEEEVDIDSFLTLGGNKEPISETDDIYKGKYYADINDDGIVDGVIYADLAFSKIGTWYGDSCDGGSYSYSAVEDKADLKDYYVSQTEYEGVFGKADVLSPTGTGGTLDRFYVMALSDVTTEEYSTFYWYYNAYEIMTDYDTATSDAFGTGKANTAKIKGYWDKDEESLYGVQNVRDLWAQIDLNSNWFIPSAGEWAAFLSAYNPDWLGFDHGEYYEMSEHYWLSSQYSLDDALCFVVGGSDLCIDPVPVNTDWAVRLSTTF